MSPRQSSGQPRLFEKKLFYGDNLRVLRMAEHFPSESVDLIYLDPPFKPNEKYNVLFRDQSDQADQGDAVVPSHSQVRAFEDTWRWGSAARQAFNDVRENAPHHVRQTLEALHSILGFSNMFAYVSMMAPRMVELHRVLGRTGSIYLHCDPAASHYLKVLLDSIFGPDQFRNEIIWKRTPFSGSSKARAMQLPRSHDVILFYSKSDNRTWNRPTLPYSEKYLARFKWKDERGPYRKTSLKTYSQETLERLRREDRLIEPVQTGAGYSYKQYLHESSGTVQIDDVWTDVNALNPVARERLGYPTQKPKALLERIIAASSNPGDVVLDPFCGCGTTIAAAEEMGRNWLGVDITYDAIPIIRNRLAERGVEDKRDYEVWGSPETATDAVRLARENPYQFQWWAVRRLGAKEIEFKKGSDKGVDGRLVLLTDAKDRFPQAVISVKSGQTGPHHVRELSGTLRAQKADVGVLVVVKPPTKGMREAAEVEGGYPGVGGEWCPRIQILTAGDIIAGVGVRSPSSVSPGARSSKMKRISRPV